MTKSKQHAEARMTQSKNSLQKELHAATYLSTQLLSEIRLLRADINKLISATKKKPTHRASKVVDDFLK